MWFSASLLFRSIHTVPDGVELWEESICLVEADTEAKALAKASAIGHREQVSYVARGEDTVTWEFVQVERVFEIEGGQPSDGVELFSRFLRKSEVESLLKPFEES